MPPNTLNRLRVIGLETGAPVVVFCSVMDGAQDDDATRAGAAGFLSKTANGATIVATLEAVVSDNTVPTVRTPERELPTTTSVRLGENDGLSDREAAVVSLIVAGLSNEEIADALYLSIDSVKTHIRSAYRQMGVASRTQAILWGVNRGFQLTAPAARLNEGGQR